MPTFVKTKTFASGESPIASADLNSIGNDVASFLNTTKLDSDNIQDLGITAGKLAGSIGASKLSATTAGYVLLGTTTTGVPTFTAISGDITVTGGGVTAIGASKVTNAMLAGSITAANLAGSIPYSKLSLSVNDIPASVIGTLADGKILLGNGSNVATAVTPSGDVTMTNAGVTAIGTNKVTAPMLADGAILLGSTSVTSNIVSASTTAVQVTGVTVTVTIPAGGRKVVIKGGAKSMFNSTSTGGNVSNELWDGTVGSGTRLAANDSYSSTQNAPVSAYIETAPQTVSAGSKTYNMGFYGTTANNKSINGDSTSPIWIAVYLV